jgi:hypothetical protein
MSVQYDMRFGASDDEDDDGLRTEIGQRISECEVFLAPTNPVASRRRWLQWEISHAKQLGKPIIGIARRRNDRVSKFVKRHADDIVDTWRMDHIVNAIRLYRREYRATNILVPPPQVLPPEQPDTELDAEPSPPIPDVVAEAIERGLLAAPGELPRDVLHREFGNIRPGELYALPKERVPRWWWPFG